MPRKTKIEVTKQDQFLLFYPPTEDTWICQGSRSRDGESVTCGMINPRYETSCVLCRTKRPRKPKRLWPDYVRACEKVGIEPGMMWKVGSNNGTRRYLMRAKGESWKESLLPEGVTVRK